MFASNGSFGYQMFKTSGATFIRHYFGGWPQEWQRLDNFGCNTPADLASLLGDTALCYCLTGSLGRDTPMKVYPKTANQIFLLIGLSGIGSESNVLSILFKQNPNNNVSAIWNKGDISLSFTDNTSFVSITSPDNNTTCMVLSNYHFNLG